MALRERMKQFYTARLRARLRKRVQVSLLCCIRVLYVGVYRGDRSRCDSNKVSSRTETVTDATHARDRTDRPYCVHIQLYGAAPYCTQLYSMRQGPRA